MKIRTRLLIVTIFSISTALIVGLILLLASRQVNGALNRNRIVDEVVKGVFELNILTNHYLLGREERAQIQWGIRHDSLTELLLGTELRNPEDEETLTRMMQNQESMKDIFSNLVTNFKSLELSENEAIGSKELEDRLIGKLLVNSQEMASNAFRLAEGSHAVVAGAQQRSSLLVMTFIVALIVVMGATSLLIRISVVKPIAFLQDGARIIADGNLDHKVKIRSHDEIGQLSEAFNNMTTKLKKSHTHLQEEFNKHKLTAEALERQTQELARSNTELEEFAYITSHDLKAPLRGISSLADWLETDYIEKLDEDGKEMLDLLIKRVTRMDGLINGILQYSRVGRIKEETVKIDLNELVGEILDTIDPPEKIEIVKNELPTIQGESIRLAQVFQNLLSNAIKYMDKAQGKITIGCIEVNGYWQFHVGDNGPGIEEKHFDKIFQIFQTLNPRDEVEGTGVGLSLVKKIVETNGGKIWLESEVGRGSKFFFTSPKNQEENHER